MLTSSEIQSKQFKAGLGFDKKDVEQFLHELSSDFDALMNENEELKKKLKDINESISYYKSIEKTLQKALILAEKTAQDTRATALREAEAIELEAKAKAEHLLADTRKQIEFIEHKSLNLLQQYDLFKIQFENLLHSQLELLNSRSFSINTEDFTYKEEPVSKTMEPDPLDPEELAKTLAAAAQEPDTIDKAMEDTNQLHFEFLNNSDNEKSIKTEDGFEFINIH